VEGPVPVSMMNKYVHGKKRKIKWILNSPFMLAGDGATAAMLTEYQQAAVQVESG